MNLPPWANIIIGTIVWIAAGFMFWTAYQIWETL